MSGEEFDWYDDEIDVVASEISERKEEIGIGGTIFNFCIRTSLQLCIVCLVLLLFRRVFGFNEFSISGINFNILLIAITVLTFTLIGIYVIVSLIRAALIGVGMVYGKVYMSNDDIRRLVCVFLWCVLNIYLFKIYGYALRDAYWYINKLLLVGTTTSAAFIGSGLSIENFYNYYVKKSLKSKVGEVLKKESILRAMKNYIYDVGDELNTVESTAICDALCCGPINGRQGGGSNLDMSSGSTFVFYESILIGRPETSNALDAKTLARDVFIKASDGKERMTFDDFCQIFPDSGMSINAFAYFDTDDSREISKATFRDTIIEFHNSRVKLDESIRISEKFVHVVGNIIKIAIVGVLILEYLVIFGVSVKDLFTFALSSALVLNFIMSGIAKNVYEDFMLVLSHPFDVDDDVIINGVGYRVFEIGLGSTSFLESNGGKIQFLNSELWNKNVINMTRAPEKKLEFRFTLDSSISVDQFKSLIKRIQRFLSKSQFNFYREFSLESTSEASLYINRIDCSLILRCRGCKTRTKRFYLRVEISKFLGDTFKELGIKVL